jgi:uncharacterized protein YndB with AHSA1/START domain
LREGGAFSSRMEAKDGSMGFDFAGTYTKIVEHKLIEYSFGDRMAQVEFTPDPKGVVIRVQSFFAWESLEMAKAFRKGGQALYRIESSSIFRADQSWLTLGVQNAIASLSAHRYWSGAPSGTPRWEILLAAPVRVMERID